MHTKLRMSLEGPIQVCLYARCKYQKIYIFSNLDLFSTVRIPKRWFFPKAWRYILITLTGFMIMCFCPRLSVPTLSIKGMPLIERFKVLGRHNISNWLVFKLSPIYVFSVIKCS